MSDLFEPILNDPTPAAPSILPLYGGADKFLEAMTDKELNYASEQVYVKVREQAFSRGLPVIIKRNGQLIKEFADGHCEPLT